MMSCCKDNSSGFCWKFQSYTTISVFISWCRDASCLFSSIFSASATVRSTLVLIGKAQQHPQHIGHFHPQAFYLILWKTDVIAVFWTINLESSPTSSINIPEIGQFNWNIFTPMVLIHWSALPVVPVVWSFLFFYTMNSCLSIIIPSPCCRSRL